MKQNKLTDKTTPYAPLMGDFNAVGLYQMDPAGSYTGVPELPFEDPVQNADDL